MTNEQKALMQSADKCGNAVEVLNDMFHGAKASQCEALELAIDSLEVREAELRRAVAKLDETAVRNSGGRTTR